MSYPDPRYLSDKGEISAKFRPANQEPELLVGSDTAMRYLATGASTERTIRFVHGTPGSALPQDYVRIVLHTVWDDAAVHRRALDRRNCGGFSVRPRGGSARLPQRVRRAGIDAPSLRTRWAARGVL
jgi:hypothetical protein